MIHITWKVMNQEVTKRDYSPIAPAPGRYGDEAGDFIVGRMNQVVNFG